MTIILRNTFMEDVAHFDLPGPVLVGDYFDVKKKYARGQASIRYRVTGRAFELHSKRVGGPNKEPLADVHALVCIVVPGA